MGGVKFLVFFVRFNHHSYNRTTAAVTTVAVSQTDCVIRACRDLIGLRLWQRTGKGPR
jgi:hypothetical protein